MKALSEFKRQFKGRSFPCEISTTNGEALILKLKGSGLGVSGLVREFIVNRIAQSLGWEVPSVEPIMVPFGFVWPKETDAFNDAVQSSYGVNLGIQLIPEAEPLPETEIKKLSIRFLQRMAALDVYFRNEDRKATSQNILRQKNGKTWMIDHGNCLFLEPGTSHQAFFIPPDHILAKEKIQFLTPELLRDVSKMEWAEKAISELPFEWLDEMQTSTETLIEILAQRSRRLANELA